MKKNIIRFGGLVPTYLTANASYTCNPSEAQSFSDIDEAKKAFDKINYSGSKGVSVRDAKDLSFMAWLNY